MSSMGERIGEVREDKRKGKMALCVTCKHDKGIMGCTINGRKPSADYKMRCNKWEGSRP